MDYKLGQSNSATTFDKNRPLQNCSTFLSDESIVNISNTVIHSSSPNSLLNTNFIQLSSQLTMQPETQPVPQLITTSISPSLSLPATLSNLSEIAPSLPITSSGPITVITNTTTA